MLYNKVKYLNKCFVENLLFLPVRRSPSATLDRLASLAIRRARLRCLASLALSRFSALPLFYAAVCCSSRSPRASRPAFYRSSVQIIKVTVGQFLSPCTHYTPPILGYNHMLTNQSPSFASLSRDASGVTSSPWIIPPLSLRHRSNLCFSVLKRLLGDFSTSISFQLLNSVLKFTIINSFFKIRII